MCVDMIYITNTYCPLAKPQLGLNSQSPNQGFLGQPTTLDYVVEGYFPLSCTRGDLLSL